MGQPFTNRTIFDGLFPKHYKVPDDIYFFFLKEKHLTLLGLFPFPVVGFIFTISFVAQVNEDEGDIHKP